MTCTAIYGYRKKPGDKNLWFVDDEAAAVVRRIFHMTIEGKGPSQIARILTDEKIMRVSLYIALRDGRAHMPACVSESYSWDCTTVKHILDRPEYMGHTVNFRSYKDSYKDKKRKFRPKEEWQIFEETHEAIVDAETWHTAQRCRKVVRRPNSTGEANPLTGLVYCADCGSRMHNHRLRVNKYDSDDSYNCNLYINRYPHKCTTHYIKTSVLRTLVFDAIKAVSVFVRDSEEEFIHLVREASELQSMEAAKIQKEQLAKSHKRHTELDALIKRLYEDKVAGSLSEKRFEILSREYENEQEDLERQITDLKAGLERFKDDSERANKFVEIVRRYTNFDELTGTMLNEYVDKILIHESEGERQGYGRTQRVEVYLNFIGKFTVPEQQETALEVLEPVEHKRSVWRAYYHRNRDNILVEKRQRTEERKAAKLAEKMSRNPAEIAAEGLRYNTGQKVKGGL